MRIVHYNCTGPEFKGREFQYDAHHAHMIDELRQRGHEVLHINPAGILGKYDSLDAYAEVTLNEIRKFQEGGAVDLFFATAVDFNFAASTAEEISKLGIPTVNLNMDDMSHPYRVEEVTKGFDLVATTDPTNMDVIRSYGAKKLIHFPFAANPNMFYPVYKDDFERAICFIGACYGARSRAIALLAQADVPIRVYGKSPMDIYGEDVKSVPALRALMNYRDGWQRAVKSLSYATGRACVRGALLRTLESTFRDTPEKHPMKGDVEYRPGPSFAEWSNTMGSCAMSLGSLELASTFVLKEPLQFIRFREFEAAMCGTVHLATYSEELAEYFEEDKEMLYYRGFEDLIDKARFYLAPERDAKRMEIRKAAAARARAEHTWTHRFQSIFDALGVKTTV